MAARRGRHAGGDHGEDRPVRAHERRHRPCRPRLGCRRSLALHGRRRADRGACPGRDPHAGPVQRVRSLERGARVCVPCRRGGDLARSTHTRGGGAVGADTRRRLRDGRPQRGDRRVDVGDDRRGRAGGCRPWSPAGLLRGVDRAAVLRRALVAGDDRASGWSRRPRRGGRAVLRHDVGAGADRGARARRRRPVRLRRPARRQRAPRASSFRAVRLRSTRTAITRARVRVSPTAFASWGTSCMRARCPTPASL